MVEDEVLSVDPSDEELQEYWDKLIDSAVRVGIVELDGDDALIRKEFYDHVNDMLEKGVMDIRMAIIGEELIKHDYVGLSDLETAWLTTIGDFMLCNNKFPAKEGDWYNATQLVTAIIRERMEEEVGR